MTIVRSGLRDIRVCGLLVGNVIGREKLHTAMEILDNPAVGSELHNMGSKKDHTRDEQAPGDAAVLAPERKEEKDGEHNEEIAWH